MNAVTAASPVPRIYTMMPIPRLGAFHRLIAAAIAGCALTVLIVATLVQPSPKGVGTHLGLGFSDCQILQQTGLPCPACGMTTSFAWFVRGNLAASFYVQPMGMLLAIATAMTFWTALYVASTGNVVRRLLREVPGMYVMLPIMAFGLAAWGWKIYIHLRGIDGWG